MEDNTEYGEEPENDVKDDTSGSSRLQLEDGDLPQGGGDEGEEELSTERYLANHYSLEYRGTFYKFF